MSQVVEIADLVIKTDQEMPGRLLVHKNRKWEVFYDGCETFGEYIHNIGATGNKIIVYAGKGKFITEDFGRTWRKIESSEDFSIINQKLYLDDIRPIPEGFIGVRSYNEFVEFIKMKGFPDFISFDHDLGEGKSGFDCAKFLVEYCLDRDISQINFKVHSQNPVGKENIEGLLNNFNNIKR